VATYVKDADVIFWVMQKKLTGKNSWWVWK